LFWLGGDAWCINLHQWWRQRRRTKCSFFRLFSSTLPSSPISHLEVLIRQIPSPRSKHKWKTYLCTFLFTARLWCFAFVMLESVPIFFVLCDLLLVLGTDVSSWCMKMIVVKIDVVICVNLVWCAILVVKLSQVLCKIVLQVFDELLAVCTFLCCCELQVFSLISVPFVCAYGSIVFFWLFLAGIYRERLWPRVCLKDAENLHLDWIEAKICSWSVLQMRREAVFWIGTFLDVIGYAQK